MRRALSIIGRGLIKFCEGVDSVFASMTCRMRRNLGARVIMTGNFGNDDFGDVTDGMSGEFDE